ncbi:hypothetical protein PQO01_12610 [Lentisphaera marina]|uniref:hypothetical protein n=1 Tax=Lentisphaera marina TaxID=1111041 RepID=UPI0023662F6E|nr:hypothetical protein [Lentisphaera marina]MDD7985794.1 hypothetical protein [Lentisphaera marina]
MISEIEFLRNQNHQARERAIINFKLVIFSIVFITFFILNKGKYVGADSNMNERFLLGLWLLYPVYLFVFKKIAMKKYALNCASCDTPISLIASYKKSEDLNQLKTEQCGHCKTTLDLENLKPKNT